jgi:Rrf2 family protein
MRLSRLADYAIVVMTHVAQYPDTTHTAAGSAVATRLPAPTVARLMAQLGRAGLLVSERGARGGYRLARPAAAIPIGVIVSLFDGPVRLTRCAQPHMSPCEVESVCPSRVGLLRLNVAVRKALDDVSLADIARPGAAALHTPPAATQAAAPRDNLP